MSFLRFLMLLSLVVWIGGIIFFAFVVAPALFTMVPSQHIAGLVVARSLISLHWIGIVSAVVFLLCAMVSSRGPAKVLLVGIMLALTLILQFGIVRRMEQLRASVPNADVSVLAANNPTRAQFDRLHSYSTKLEGSVLVLGLITIFLVAREGAVGERALVASRR